MSATLGVLAVLLALTALFAVFLRVDAARLAGGLRAAGPAVLGIVGLVLLVTGRAGIGGMLLSGAFAWYGASRVNRNRTRTPGQRSTVRTAALEMELNHDTGGLEGLVLAGRHESKALGSMALPDLEELYRELSGDAESRQLLKT